MLLHSNLAVVTALQIFLAINVLFSVEGKIGFGPGEQEWGYVTVRPHAHMFWWLYYTTSKNLTDVHEKPPVIWLQGGPGGSSTGYGNFEELGPLDLDLNPRNYTWVNDYNVLIIDNPIGTGFSYANNSSSFAKNNAQIALDLLECTRGFLQEFPTFATVPTYILSECYGGKMAAEFALIWHKAQKKGDIKSQLQGLALGDAWISPIDSMRSWAPFLLMTEIDPDPAINLFLTLTNHVFFFFLFMGMIDTLGFEQIWEAVETIKVAIDNENWRKSMDLWFDTRNITEKLTDKVNVYNILYKITGKEENKERYDILDILINSKIKNTLGIQATWGAQAINVIENLYEDFMKPVIDIVELLLNKTDIEVFVYNGQLDLIVPTSGTVVWVENMNWKNSNEWHKAHRHPLIVDGVIEGFIKKYDNFKFFWINRAGHMVPKDNPAATAAMLKYLTAKATFKLPENSTIDLCDIEESGVASIQGLTAS